MIDTPMTRSENMTEFLEDLDRDPKREPFATILWHLKEAERELSEARNAAVCTHGRTTASASGWALMYEAAIGQRDEARAQLREEQHLHTATLNERDRLAEALERIDYCLSNAEDVMHGAGSDDVTISRRIIINALAAAKEQQP
jgi:hypothetical protein